MFWATQSEARAHEQGSNYGEKIAATMKEFFISSDLRNYIHNA